MGAIIPWLDAYFPTDEGSITRGYLSGTTADATQTTIGSIPLDDNTVTSLDVLIQGRATLADKGCRFAVVGCWGRRAAGDPFVVRAVVVSDLGRTDSGLAATLVLNGDNVDVKVTGLAATAMVWSAAVQAMKV